MMGLIRRTFSLLSIDTFKKLYSAFVRSHIEFSQVVWFPHRLKLINLIEGVQIRATKLVNNLSLLDYADRLKALKLTTLTYRRFRGDMIIAAKLLRFCEELRFASLLHRFRGVCFVQNEASDQELYSDIKYVKICLMVQKLSIFYEICSFRISID